MRIGITRLLNYDETWKSNVKQSPTTEAFSRMQQVNSLILELFDTENVALVLLEVQDNRKQL